MVLVIGMTFLNKNAFVFFETLLISLIINNVHINELALKSK